MLARVNRHCLRDLVPCMRTQPHDDLRTRALYSDALLDLFMQHGDDSPVYSDAFDALVFRGVRVRLLPAHRRLAWLYYMTVALLATGHMRVPAFARSAAHVFLLAFGTEQLCYLTCWHARLAMYMDWQTDSAVHILMHTAEILCMLHALLLMYFCFSSLRSMHFLICFFFFVASNNYFV